MALTGEHFSLGKEEAENPGLEGSGESKQRNKSQVKP